MLTELDGERAAQRGNPSLLWRAGQNRRLEMILQWAPPAKSDRKTRVLVDGCGAGMYVKALADAGMQSYGIDIEAEHLQLALMNCPGASLQMAACEHLPYGDDLFDLVLSHEVLEHVQDDRAAAHEMVRVLRPGGRAVIFAPNRLYPFETHGHYWKGTYHFGNTPLINYLPDLLRNRLAPHVRAYTPRSLLDLFIGTPARVRYLTQIFPGSDTIVARRPRLGLRLRRITYAMEQSPLTIFGLSHLLVVEKK